MIFNGFLLLGCLIALVARAGDRQPITVVDPETQVELSLLDGSPKPLRRRLPSNYGEKVAQVIESLKPRLMECAPAAKNSASAIDLVLVIEPSGKGEASKDDGVRVQGPETEALFSCVGPILDQAPWPKHGLATAVQVKFPLTLKRRSI